MKDTFASDFEATLKRMKWPGKDVTMAGDLEREWSNGVEKLLELQEPELKARDNEVSRNGIQEEQLVLLPLEVMAKPLELGFKYHFTGEKVTNKLDKVSMEYRNPTRAELTVTAGIFSFSHHSLAKHV